MYLIEMKLLKTKKMSFMALALVLVLLIQAGEATLGKSDRKKVNAQDNTKENSKDQSVKQGKSAKIKSKDSGLLSMRVTAADIVANAAKRTTDGQKRFGISSDGGGGEALTVLGYVTPWNGAGYDAARLHAGSKVDLVSPVWLQLKVVEGVKSGERYSILGQHDVDRRWVEDLRASGAKVLPRVLFDGWTGQDYMDLFQVHYIIIVITFHDSS